MEAKTAIQEQTTQLNDSITINRLHIRSDIRHRFAETVVTSTITNNAGFAQDVTFDVRLPNEAFISNFSMLIDGVVYPGRVEDKSAGERRFDEAVSRGESAGKVSVNSARETNEFTVTVNVAAVSHVTFNLTYQELLQRKRGLYEQVIYLNPGEVVPDLRVVVHINESREITELSVPEIRGDELSVGVLSGTNRYAQITSFSPSEAEVVFAPTPDQQREYSPQGVAGQFILNYDVDRTNDQDGEILVTDGYFVHFFAPENLPPIGKRIMFVLDTSGSMSGRKNQQLIEALKFILGELRPQDKFGILLFSDVLQVWEPEGLINATQGNIDRAQTFANSIGAAGGTNINDGLLRGLEFLGSHITEPSMILFLTDGQATSGETSPDAILENVRSARHPRQSILALAFGKGADFGLLQRISIQNEGFARKIFEDADAALQLAGFYDEISSPLLSEVAISYTGGLVNESTVTRSVFPTFFSGSEIVVAGRYQDPDQMPASLGVFVEGSQSDTYLFKGRQLCISPWRDVSRTQPLMSWYHPGPWPCPHPIPPRFPPPVPVVRPTTFLERLWVYLTIKQLVDKQLEERNSSSIVATEAKAEALELSLKYNFVTPYTTMVATKPKDLNVSNSFGPSEDKPAAGGPVSLARVASVRKSGPVVGLGRIAAPPQLAGSAPILRPAPVHVPAPQFIPSFPSPTATHTQTTTTTTTTTTRPTTRLHFTQLPTLANTPVTVHPRTTTRPYHPTTTTTTTSQPFSPPPPVLTNSQATDLPSGLNIELNITSVDGQGGFLCLDIVTSTSPNDNNLILLNDTHSDLLVTGELHSREYNGQRKFESVSVFIGDAEMLTVSIDSITTSQRTYRWWELSSVNGQGVGLADMGGIEYTAPNNVSLTFHKYGIKTRRSLSSPYITVAVKDTDLLSQEATGIIGTLLELSNFRLGLDNRLLVMKDGAQKEFVTTSDKLRDGAPCHRIARQSDLIEILAL